MNWNFDGDCIESVDCFWQVYKAQVHVDQGTPHKTRDTEIYRGESGEKPRRYGHRGKRIVFAILGFLLFQINLQIALSNSLKN